MCDLCFGFVCFVLLGLLVCLYVVFVVLLVCSLRLLVCVVCFCFFSKMVVFSTTKGCSFVFVFFCVCRVCFVCCVFV